MIDFLSLGKNYLCLWLLIALIIILSSIIYSRFTIEKKTHTMFKQIILKSIAACYFILIIGITLLDRSNLWQNQTIMPLFHSYKDAWINFSVTSWKNIILNFFLFVPLGILVPMIITKCRTLWKTTLVAILFAFSIETVQLLTGIGIFEFDDILGNTMGAMIGYGLYELSKFLFVMKKDRTFHSKSLKKVIFLQLPLCLTIALFSFIFVSYNTQELGQLRNQCVIPFQNISVSSNIEYNDISDSLPIYRIQQKSTIKETTSFAKTFFGNIGTTIDESRNDFYEDTAVYYSADKHSLWIDYVGGNYKFFDYDTIYPDEPIYPVIDADEKTIRKKLEDYGVYVPTGTNFDITENGEYKFNANKLFENGILYDGTITCEYYTNGCFSKINNNILVLVPYKDYEVISKKKAYEKLCAGEFYYPVNDVNDHIDIIVDQCEMEYVIDTKGYYQPVYSFSSEINGRQYKIQIPALRN